MIRKYIIITLLVILSSCEKSTDENAPVLKLYGDALEDIGYSISKTSDGYFIGGQFTEVYRSGNSIDSSLKKMAIIKTDSEGNTLWKKSFGYNMITTVGSKILALEDGSVVCTGYVIDTATDEKDIFIVKVSANGESAIQKVFYSGGNSSNPDGDDGNQSGIDVVKSPDGFVLLGSTDLERLQGAEPSGNIRGNRDIYLLKLDNNLEPQGVPEIVGYPGNDTGVAIRSSGDGGYIIAGTTDKSEPGQSLNNILIVKTNGNATPVQNRILGTDDDEYASDVEVLSDGYVIAGTVGSESADQSVYISKLPLNIFGQPVFSRKYKPESASSTATSFAVMAISRYRGNSFVMAGQAGSGASAKMLVFAADPDGNLVEGKVMITAASGIQVAYDVVTDEDDNIIAVGKNSFENNSMISFYKFRF